MTIRERLADAELLWDAGRREGALFSVLTAVTAAARDVAPPGAKDGEAFRAFVAHDPFMRTQVEHRGQLVPLDHLLWKWLRCEVAHRGGLPVDIKMFAPDGERDTRSVQAGGAPLFCVRLSDGWYWWLRSLVEDWANAALVRTGSHPAAY